MRDSPFKSDLMDGGRGGQAFASLYDQQLAQRMGHAAGKKLVNAIVRKIEANTAYRVKTRYGWRTARMQQKLTGNGSANRWVSLGIPPHSPKLTRLRQSLQRAAAPARVDARTDGRPDLHVELPRRFVRG